MAREIKVIELFAGVGGFRIGLTSASNSKIKYKTIWANQFEPSTKKQHASEVYVARFGKKGFDNRDIELVIDQDFATIPNHDLLVGGFPCQDYSVASTLKNSRGIIGKKGILFWSIYTILRRKGDKAPNYILLENVDRLLKSPTKQRGKDFAIMLAALSDLGYAIEWRVVNAADYGFPQRRRRIFILGYKKGTKLYDEAVKTDPTNWLTKTGILANAFPAQQANPTNKLHLKGSYVDITNNFSIDKPVVSPFKNTGLIINRQVITCNTTPIYNNKITTLGDVLVDERNIPEDFFISKEKISTWKYLKGAKKEERKTTTGHVYHYSEGAMVFPDALDKPSRTIITGEGGSGASRFKHVVKTPSGRLRRLTPIELERLNMFPDDHTKLAGVSDGRRAFFMGNALVVGVIEKIGKTLTKRI